MQRYLSDFHKKTIQERMQILQLLYPQMNGSYNEGMDLKTADLMIENCIGKMSLPVGLGLNFLINSKEYIIPMSTEEPSIVAAASAAAKFIKEHGGFKASCTAPLMLGQIQVLDIDCLTFNENLQEQKLFLIKQANTLYCQRMVARGGGVTDITFQSLSSTSGVVEIKVNVGEAMGANIVNTICEGLAGDFVKMFPCRIGLKILSNF
jgi:degradative hydroxymethylglutaryl-CoA reductase